ncbi:Aste57867_864 [Aphanomyces stellatus]|uniref:Aste57867_864 protein n=1 Tax=Aphanomyces stellatus TaxID=120398 RepID=A0A485K3Z9_9STRA|nr:hypothetical protein As57867_000863 [Aphanomyces stellatus]VFT78088.1 Aste57867_864 [Aphanomyces stellatus]
MSIISLSGSALGSSIVGRGGAPSSSSSSHTLPLPHDYFPTPNLTPNETDFFNSVARKSCTKVIYYARRHGGPVTWVPMSSSSPQVQVFSGKKAGDSSTVAYFCAMTQLRASLDDVARVFRSESTAQFRDYAKTFAPDYIDCATLTNLVVPTEMTPMHYIGVKWAAVESPTMFIKPRDFCYLECQDEFVDRRTGRRGWVNSMHSVNWQVCPPMDKSHGLVRGSIYRSGYVFIESETPNCLEVVHVLQVDMKGNVPQWVMNSIMKRRVMEVGRLQHFFRVKTLDVATFFTQHTEPRKHALSCQICRDKFAFTKRHCRKCGTVVCKKCSSDVVLDLPDVGPTKMRVCVVCTKQLDSTTAIEASATTAADEFWDDEPKTTKSDARRHGMRFQSADWFLSHRAALMANPFRPSVSLSCDAANSDLVADIADASVEVHEENLPETSKFPMEYTPRRAVPASSAPRRVNSAVTAQHHLRQARQAREGHKLGESFGIEHFNPDDIAFHSLDRPSSVSASSFKARDEWQFNSLLAVRPSQMHNNRVSDVSDLSIDEEDEPPIDEYAAAAPPPLQVLDEEEPMGGGGGGGGSEDDELVAAVTPVPVAPVVHPYTLVSDSLICPSVQDRRTTTTPSRRSSMHHKAVSPPPPSAAKSIVGRPDSLQRRASRGQLDDVAARVAERLLRAESLDKDMIRATLEDVLRETTPQ